MTQRATVVEEEVTLDRDGVTVPATLLHPPGTGPWPAWVVLHGITRPGRAHAQLVRFTRAVASTGSLVLVPEVPEWRELELAPDLTVPTLLAALRTVVSHPSVQGERAAVVGFSFGAPQAVAATADPRVAQMVEGVVGFGGYCDLERTIRFQFTGHHEGSDGPHRLRPDPYGRWIVGANYLTGVPGFEDMTEVARALRRLAASAGDQGVVAWDPRFDEEKEELAAPLPPDQREVFELFAPHSSGEPDTDAVEGLIPGLARAALAADPGLDPRPALPGVDAPVHLLHGRHDHLIPFTEAHRLAEALPPKVPTRVTITPLFGHSAQDPFPGPLKGVKEGAVFLRALRDVLALV